MLTTFLAAGFLIYGLSQVTRELHVTQLAETQIKSFSALASQIDVFAIKSVNAGPTTEAESESALTAFREPVARTFEVIRKTLAESVDAARDLGDDEQARRATQSITVARMEAQFKNLSTSLETAMSSPDAVMSQLSAFSTQFTPLLTNAIGEEQRRRDQAIKSINATRDRLSLYATMIVLTSVSLLLLYYFGLVRPQFSRLTALQFAAREIGQENFKINLPKGPDDEIGRVISETNAMTFKLNERRDAINADWDRLREIIAERTAELRTANAALAQRDIDRRRFFADISHEMRTPLTVILTEAELAAAEHRDSAPAFDIIRNRAQRLSRRVDDLLRIARSDTGQISLDSKAFALDQAAKIAIDEMQSRVSCADMELRTNLGPATAFGDPNWTRQIITGLIDNCVRHSGGDQITVSVTSGDTLSTVEVGDNGKGFDYGATPFERFTKDDASPGFGIGLALAKWVVEKQNGAIRVAEDRKSVIVQLPISADGAT